MHGGGKDRRPHRSRAPCRRKPGPCTLTRGAIWADGHGSFSPSFRFGTEASGFLRSRYRPQARHAPSLQAWAASCAPPRAQAPHAPSRPQNHLHVSAAASVSARPAPSPTAPSSPGILDDPLQPRGGDERQFRRGPAHDVQVVKLKSIGRTAGMVAARNQHPTSPSHGGNLVEAAVIGIDALHRPAGLFGFRRWYRSLPDR